MKFVIKSEEFAGKYCEAIGQSLLYSIEMGKDPGILLILEDPIKDKIYVDRLMEVIQVLNGEGSFKGRYHIRIMTPIDLRNPRNADHTGIN